MSQVKTQLIDDGDRMVAKRTQDIEAILDHNKRLQNQSQKFGGYGDARWHHVATIPNVIIEKWMIEDGVNLLAMRSEEFEKFIEKKLRDPDNAWLRTTRKF
jgi:hypothetical protein